MHERAPLISSSISRRNFYGRLASLISAFGITGTALASAASKDGVTSAGGEEVSHSAESIHQEVVFKASPKRIYEALTDAKQFTKVTALIADMSAGPAEISREAGGSFSCFGGRIVGRHVELVPNERIVQAWRVAAWDEGIYSIVRFELKEEGSGTRLVFDHTGFPNGDGEHLASGWKAHYWEPLAKFLA
jgi:activator of HSP90 ATPase